MTLILYGGLRTKEILVVEDAYYRLGERQTVRVHINVQDIIAGGESELLI